MSIIKITFYWLLLIMIDFYIKYILYSPMQCRISLVIPTIFLTYIQCRKRIITMICESYLKPNEAIIVISEFNNTKSVKRYKCGILFILLFMKGKRNQAENRNKGIIIAKCNYISFFDSDDYMSKSRLKIIYYTFMTYNNIDLILHTFTYSSKSLYEDSKSNFEMNNLFYNYSSLDIYNSYLKNRNASIYLKYCCRFLNESMSIHNAWLSGKSKIFKKNLYNENKKYYRVEDTELNNRLILKRYNLILIKLKLGIYIPHSKCIDGLH